MNSEQLTLERGRVAHDLMRLLVANGYDYEQQVSEDSMFFEVKHADLPNWHKFVNILAVAG